MMSAAAKFVLLSLALLVFACTGAMAYPQSHQTSDVEELRSALAMSQMILAQQAQLFRELINATKENHRCCNAGKSGEARCQFCSATRDILLPKGNCCRALRNGIMNL